MRWIVAIGAVLAAAIIWLWRRDPSASDLPCDEEALIASVQANATSGSQLPDWPAVHICLLNMAIDVGKGEKDHLLVPLESHTIDVIKLDSVRASIFPRRNIWWDRLHAMKAGRVMAKVEAQGQYDRLGLTKENQGDNYLVVWGSKPLKMAMINDRGSATLLSAPNTVPEDADDPRYIGHGPITVAGFTPDPSDPPPNGNPHHPVLSDRSPDPSGSLSVGALQCVTAGKKACFVDGKESQVTPPVGAFGIGMPLFNGGSSQPWVSCTKYGCCCGGQQCHN